MQKKWIRMENSPIWPGNPILPVFLIELRLIVFHTQNWKFDKDKNITMKVDMQSMQPMSDWKILVSK